MLAAVDHLTEWSAQSTVDRERGQSRPASDPAGKPSLLVPRLSMAVGLDAFLKLPLKVVILLLNNDQLQPCCQSQAYDFE